MPDPQPDGYYFSYLAPDERPATGDWTSSEIDELRHVAGEHVEKVHSGAWGLLSMHLPGRTGAQCKVAYEAVRAAGAPRGGATPVGRAGRAASSRATEAIKASKGGNVCSATSGTTSPNAPPSVATANLGAARVKPVVTAGPADEAVDAASGSPIVGSTLSFLDKEPSPKSKDSAASPRTSPTAAKPAAPPTPMPPVVPRPPAASTPAAARTPAPAPALTPMPMAAPPTTSPPTPTPVAPTPVAPSSVAPSPVAPSPVAAPTPAAATPLAQAPVPPTQVSPIPVAPTQVAPTQVAPIQVAPTRVAPTQVAPTLKTTAPKAPAPVAPAPKAPTPVAPSAPIEILTGVSSSTHAPAKAAPTAATAAVPAAKRRKPNAPEPPAEEEDESGVAMPPPAPRVPPPPHAFDRRAEPVDREVVARLLAGMLQRVPRDNPPFQVLDPNYPQLAAALQTEPDAATPPAAPPAPGAPPGRRLSASEAIGMQASALAELRMRRRWLNRMFEDELSRVETPAQGVAADPAYLARARQTLAAKFRELRTDLLAREELQLQSLSAMQAWEASGRGRKAGAPFNAAPQPVFAVYAPPAGMPAC